MVTQRAAEGTQPGAEQKSGSCDVLSLLAQPGRRTVSVATTASAIALAEAVVDGC